HLFERRKMLTIDREGSIALLIVDVEIDHVRGNFPVTKSFDDLAGAGLRIVAVAALLITERPERRQGRMPGHGRVFFHDFFRLGPRAKVIIQLAALRAKREIVRRLLTKVESAPVSVVEEHAIGDALAQSGTARDGFVERG